MGCVFQAWYKKICQKSVTSINPNSHKGFFISRLSPWKGRGQKMEGLPPRYEPEVSCTKMHCPPLACHSGVAARAAISCPYDTHLYDVMGLSAFSSLPLVGFCWTEGQGQRDRQRISVTSNENYIKWSIFQIYQTKNQQLVEQLNKKVQNP